MQVKRIQAALAAHTELTFPNTTFSVSPLPKEAVSSVPRPKRQSREERAAEQEQAALVAEQVKETLDLTRVERRLSIERLTYSKLWTRNESAGDAADRADTRIARAFEAWWALEKHQGRAFTSLLSLPARTREALKPRGPEMTLIIGSEKMSRVRRGRRANMPPAWTSLSAHADKRVPDQLSSLPLPKRKGVLFRNTAVRDEVLRGWLCQLGQFDARDTWRAILDACNLAEAQGRLDEVRYHGFLKGGNRVEAQDGQDRRMPVSEDELIPVTVQTKLSRGEDVIPGMEELLLKLLTEAGELPDLTSVQEANIQQSETFTHSEANELVPWDIARDIRTAPQTLQDAQATLERFQRESEDQAEQNALYRLAHWVESQEAVSSRKRQYGKDSDPDFVELAFTPDRQKRSVPEFPGYASFTAILGDTVGEVEISKQWAMMYTLGAALKPLINGESPVVTTAAPGVGSVAAVLAKKRGTEVSLLHIDVNTHESFRVFQQQAMKNLKPLFVPAEHESAALVAMMSASRVVIVTSLPCTTPVHNGGAVTHLPVKYAAALSEAVHFRGANPEVTVVTL